MAYIFVSETGVVNGPMETATQDMLDVGWFEYNGAVPAFAKWDAATSSVIEDAEQMARMKKSIGVPYLLNGIEYLVPLTVDDQNTVTAVSVAVMANAIANTVVEFSNGTSMPIAATEWMAFATWFAGERNKLFTGA